MNIVLNRVSLNKSKKREKFLQIVKKLVTVIDEELKKTQISEITTKSGSQKNIH